MANTTKPKPGREVTTDLIARRIARKQGAPTRGPERAKYFAAALEMVRGRRAAKPVGGQ